MYLPIATVAAIATAVPIAFYNADAAKRDIYPRSSCSPGALSCSSDGSQFAICAPEGLTYEIVAAGTTCSCSSGTCSIVAGGASGSSNSTGSAAASASVPAYSATSSASAASSMAGMGSSSAVGSSAAASATTTGSSGVASAPAASAPATSAASTSAAGGSAASATASSTSTGSSVAYKQYLGDGSASDGWPAMSDWLSYDDLWTLNMDAKIIGSCSSFGQKDNTAEESAELKSAISSIATSSGVDARFILVEVLQESLGCVRAPTTNYGVSNPGLLQSHDGKGTCYNVDPCPVSEIDQMLQDGVEGTLDEGTEGGDGLKQCIATSHETGAMQYYQGAEIYNAGKLELPLQDNTSTKCYASDIANRLLGWVGSGKCSLDSYGKI